MRRLLTFIRSLSVGVIAQSLTLVATFIPIVLGLETEVVHLVFISGVATFLVHPATVGINSVYASIRDEGVASQAMNASATLLVMVTVVLGLGGVIWAQLGSNDVGTMVLFMAMVLLPQGIYFMVLARTARIGTYSTIIAIRLAYGISSLLFTLCASTVFRYEFSLVVAGALSFMSSAIVGIFLLKGSLGLHRLNGSGILASLRHIRKSSAIISTFALTGFAGQSSSFALPLLGPWAVAWAIATRIANGFQTVGSQLLAPRYDIEMAKFLREDEYKEAQAVYRKGTILGCFLGATASASVVGYLCWSGHILETGWLGAVFLGLSVLFFWGTQIATSVTAKMLTYSGHASVRLKWEVCRCLVILPVIFLLREGALMLGLSATMAVFMVAFIWLGFHFAARPRPL